MKRVGDSTRSWTERGGTPVSALIDLAWDDLAGLVEAGTITDGAYLRVMQRADEMPANPVGQYLVLGMLRRTLAEPHRIGENPDALTTYPCRCGPGYGMVELADGTYRPCADCNPGAHRLWRGCWTQGCRGCEQCRPGARRRGMQGDHRAEATEHQRDERRRRDLDDLR